MMHEKLHALLDLIQKAFKQEVSSADISLEALSIVVEKDSIVPMLSFLSSNEETRFNQLLDIAGVDYLGRSPRFELVYQLLSLSYNQRLMIKVKVEEGEEVPSVTSVYPCANWYEREVWDMYGISFSQHPDLRRILTDYGFEGFPLRKDFPLTGYTEVRYDPEQQRVVYEPVNLPQAFRQFDFLSPWKGMDTAASVLPGDEKAERQGA